MNQLNEIIHACDLHWKNFFILLLLLGLSWLVIQRLDSVSHRTNALKIPKSGLIIRAIYLLDLYFPLAWTLIIATFFISSCIAVFGTFAILIAIGFFPFIRQYIVGLIVRTKLNIRIHQDVLYQGEQYHVQSIASLGLHVNSIHGERFIHYENLYNHGFDLTSRRDAAVRSQLSIRLPDAEKRQEGIEILKNTLYSSPYIDFYSRPQILESTHFHGGIDINIIPRSRDDEAALRLHLLELGFEILHTS